MQVEVLIDENGFVNSYNTEIENSVLEDSTLVDIEESFGDFEANFYAYKLEDDDLVFDADEKERKETEWLRETIRQKRETECFAIVNRPQIWYNRLTNEQMQQLGDWYDAWLDAPETLIIPEKLDWL